MTAQRRSRIIPGLAVDGSECSTGEMEAAIGAIITVIGALLGSGLTYELQRLLSDHQSSLSIDAQSQRDRLDAYTAFGGAAVRFRVAALDVWHRADEGASEEVQRLAKVEFYRLRTQLVDAEIRVRLVSASGDLDTLMSEVIQTASQVPDAMSEAERRIRSDAGKAALERFLDAASGDLGYRRLPSQLTD